MNSAPYNLHILILGGREGCKFYTKRGKTRVEERFSCGAIKNGSPAQGKFRTEGEMLLLHFYYSGTINKETATAPLGLNKWI